jgi:surface antigen
MFMKSFFQIGLVMGLMVFLVGCTTNGGEKEDSKVLVIKGPIGDSMTTEDRLKVEEFLEQEKIGKAHDWSNNQTGNTYQVTIKRIFQQQCYEYIIVAMNLPQNRRMLTKACRQADDSWQTIY